MAYRDSQRQKLYNFQAYHIDGGPKLTQAEAQQLVIDCYKVMGIELVEIGDFKGSYPTVVVSNRHKRSSNWESWKNQINLAAGWGQHTRVVLHEAAHAIRDLIYWSYNYHAREANGWNDGPHGKLFTGIYFALCSKFLPIDLSDVMGKAKARKVRFDEAYATKFVPAKPVRQLTPKQAAKLAELKAMLVEAEYVLETLTGVAKAHQGNRVKGLKTKIAKLEN